MPIPSNDAWRRVSKVVKQVEEINRPPSGIGATARPRHALAPTTPYHGFVRVTEDRASATSPYIGVITEHRASDDSFQDRDDVPVYIRTPDHDTLDIWDASQSNGYGVYWGRCQGIPLGDATGTATATATATGTTNNTPQGLYIVNSGGGISAASVCALAAGIRTTDALLATVSDGQTTILTYANGAWSSEDDIEPPCTTLGTATGTPGITGTAAQTLSFWYSAGRVHLSLGGIELLHCGGLTFAGGTLTGHCADDTGSPCAGGTFTITLECATITDACCPDTARFRYRFTLDSLSTFPSPYCADLLGTYTLEYDSANTWLSVETPAYGAIVARWRLTCSIDAVDGVIGWDLRLKQIADPQVDLLVYLVTISDWDCQSELTLDWNASNLDCTGNQPTIILIPA